MPFGELIEIEEDLLRTVHAALAAAAIRVLLAFFGARVIDVLADSSRHGEIGLFDPTEHFFVQVLLQTLGRRHDRIGVGVLGLEILDDLRVRFFPQPEVIVLERAIVDRRFVRYFPGDRRLHGQAADLRQGGGYEQSCNERRREQARA